MFSFSNCGDPTFKFLSPTTINLGSRSQWTILDLRVPGVLIFVLSVSIYPFTTCPVYPPFLHRTEKGNKWEFIRRPRRTTVQDQTSVNSTHGPLTSEIFGRKDIMSSLVSFFLRFLFVRVLSVFGTIVRDINYLI